LFITGPTATHAVANAALVSGFLPKGADKFRNEKKKLSPKAKKAKAKKRAPLKGKL
jgi:hypothetical protein